MSNKNITLLKITREKIFLSRKSSRTQLMTFQCFATNIYPWFIPLFLLLIALVNFLSHQQQEQRIWVFLAQTFLSLINFLNTSPRVLAKNKWPCSPLSFMPCSKTTKETPLMQWQKPLIPIIKSFCSTGIRVWFFIGIFLDTSLTRRSGRVYRF